MEYVLALIALVSVVAFVVARPVLRGERDDAVDDARVAELEAAKEAKYREIRDAQLDREMGKLSTADHRAIERELRAEAMTILAELDRVQGREPGEYR